MLRVKAARGAWEEEEEEEEEEENVERLHQEIHCFSGNVALLEVAEVVVGVVFILFKGGGTQREFMAVKEEEKEEEEEEWKKFSLRESDGGRRCPKQKIMRKQNNDLNKIPIPPFILKSETKKGTDLMNFLFPPTQ